MEVPIFPTYLYNLHLLYTKPCPFGIILYVFSAIFHRLTLSQCSIPYNTSSLLCSTQPANCFRCLFANVAVHIDCRSGNLTYCLHAAFLLKHCHYVQALRKITRSFPRNVTSAVCSLMLQPTLITTNCFLVNFTEPP